MGNNDGLSLRGPLPDEYASRLWAILLEFRQEYDWEVVNLAITWNEGPIDTNDIIAIGVKQRE